LIQLLFFDSNDFQGNPKKGRIDSQINRFLALVFIFMCALIAASVHMDLTHQERDSANTHEFNIWNDNAEVTLRTWTFQLIPQILILIEDDSYDSDMKGTCVGNVCYSKTTTRNLAFLYIQRNEME
jgi:hypothetical protein